MSVCTCDVNRTSLAFYHVLQLTEDELNSNHIVRCINSMNEGKNLPFSLNAKQSVFLVRKLDKNKWIVKNSHSKGRRHSYVKTIPTISMLLTLGVILLTSYWTNATQSEAFAIENTSNEGFTL